MPRILAVDDEPNIVRLIQVNLERHGYQVETANNGAQALTKIKANRPDLVVSDVMMPEMDGFETIARIRRHPRLKHIPVIAVTAKAMAGDREKCIQAGASDYISKPVDIDQLMSLLRIWLYEK